MRMEKLCVNEHLSPLTSLVSWNASYHSWISVMWLSLTHFFALFFCQEPVQCATYAHSTQAEWSHHQKVLRGQARPPQHAWAAQEPDRWRELYPSPWETWVHGGRSVSSRADLLQSHEFITQSFFNSSCVLLPLNSTVTILMTVMTFISLSRQIYLPTEWRWYRQSSNSALLILSVNGQQLLVRKENELPYPLHSDSDAMGIIAQHLTEFWVVPVQGPRNESKQKWIS